MRWPHLTKTLWNSLGRKDMQTLTYWWTLGRCYHHPITIKPNIASYTAEQFSWVPSPCCSPPGCPFPIKSIALSAHVSPQTIHIQVLDKSPVSGPGRGPPSCNKWRLWRGLFFAETDIMTTRGTQGPACLPMDQTQWLQLEPFSPWSPPDVDNWPECPDQ